MKLNCGPDWCENLYAKTKWHDHFAWLPVRVGKNDCRWLETVRRKGEFTDYPYPTGRVWTWEYEVK